MPVIRIPKYLETNLGNAIYKEHMKVKESHSNRYKKTNLDPKHTNKLIISSNGEKKLNHYHGYRYDPDKVPLISKMWVKHASIGEN